MLIVFSAVGLGMTVGPGKAILTLALLGTIWPVTAWT